MTSVARFRNRTEAGQLLASQLTAYVNLPNVLVLGIPCGGVPVAFEVAEALNAPLDICLVRRLGVPGRSELAIGAISASGFEVLNENLLDWLRISGHTIAEVADRELQKLHRHDLIYRGDRPPLKIRDRIVILVDEGLATGAMMRAAIGEIAPQQPQRIIIAVPVAPPDICQELRSAVDEVVCLNTPAQFEGIGLWYEDFDRTTDDEVCELLNVATYKFYSSIW
ncbi:phosphoribosyltransferase [Chamaesiphon polymorphus]|uniref:Phosphoribosyl transferase n=1 Tax=Chamaesiphon polymorphus CCALA 037 TaxID=2107692 RepID=A0A2T1GDZ2_9CYAN|nr:phosphoribosyltransferase [Chamaesiphon polymorphus]PSB55632.1 phosphoribosyl transferase [Chamaesiphon polymorphus CCALA 037]